MPTPRAPSLLLAMACSLPAQAPAAPAAAARPVLLQLTIAGPAQWRSRLGPTSLGSMLASQAAERIWRGYADRIDAALRQARGEEAAFQRERARLLDYGGDVHVVVWLEQAEDALHVPRWSAALLATADGRTDLPAMAQECRGWLERAGALAATPWRDLQLTPPAIDGGRLLLVLAEPGDLAGARARAAALAPAPLPHPQVLRLQLDLQPALGLLRDRAFERGMVAAAIGSATRRLQLTIGSRGPALAVDVELQFAGDDRGLLRGLCPSSPGVPDLDWLLPRGLAGQRCGRADLPALWRAWLELYAAMLEVDPAAYRARLEKNHGGDLEAQLLAALADESALLWWRGSDGAETSLFGSACLVVPLRDHREQPQLLANAAAMLSRLGWWSVGTDDGGVLRAKWGTLGGELALGEGVLCVAFGDEARPCIDAVLQRAQHGRRQGQPQPLPRDAPSGCNSRGSIDAVRMLPAAASALVGLLRLFGLPIDGDLAAEAARWQPLLAQQGLQRLEALAGTDAGAWRLQLRW